MNTINDCLEFFSDKKCIFCRVGSVVWEKNYGNLTTRCNHDCFFITYEPTIRDNKIIGIFSGMKAYLGNHEYSIIYFSNENEYMLNIKKNNSNYLTRKYKATSFEDFISFIADKHDNIKLLG